MSDTEKKTHVLTPMIKGQQYYADGVPLINTDKTQLDTVLQAARDNADIRRADGRKSPTLLACEEVFRLQAQNETLLKMTNRAVALADTTRVAIEDYRKQHEKSVWFRLGRKLGFYS